MSPVLQIFKEGEKPRTLAESGHIVEYVIENYDPTGKLTGDNHDDKAMVNYYVHFSEGSLQPHLVSILVGYLATQRVPWPLSMMAGAIFSRVNSQFYSQRLLTNFEFLDRQLEKKGGGYFVGDHLTGADIMLDFPINFSLYGDSPQGGEILPGEDLVKRFPNLYKWHQKIMQEPKRIEAERIGKSKL